MVVGTSSKNLLFKLKETRLANGPSAEEKRR